ncbi:MAG: hypothetical protein LPK45_08035 [Bacteroidota bacterium]|nr:hypothetical protein [Bacteroidota bacterium]MDX5431020.1 hypothetical protein [Bacteroidota bacterium]MDX5469771.1 hypothetical protein [Bacteroidota bacterium]
MAQHLLASALFRFDAVTEDANPEFTHYAPGNDSRNTLELINHLVNVMAYAEATLTEKDRVVWRTRNLDEGINQFRFVVHQVQEYLQHNEVEEEMMEVMIHGPFSDVFGHIGQLAMMRRISGRPVKRVNYMKAPVSLRDASLQNAERVSV